MCGEQYKPGVNSPAGSGSPPRVRGTAQYYDVTNLQIRITPACAGNRFCVGCGQGRRADHPRVCGEQNSILNLYKVWWGSPPRVRGTDLRAAAGIGGVGITPACAGNSFAGRDTNAKGKDHPRVCGEQ